VQLQEPQVAGWYPQQADRSFYLQPPQLQQQHVQLYAPQAAAAEPPFSQHDASYAAGPGLFDSLAPATGPPAVAAPQKAKHRKRHKNNPKRSTASQQASSLADQQQQQQYVQPTKDQVPVKFAPCGKRDGYKVAAAVTRQLRQGQKVLMPAGTGMQLVRSTAMLSTARSMVLGHSSSTGLVFQPSFSSKAAVAAAGGAGSHQQHRQQQQQQQQQWQQHPSADDRSISSNSASTSAPNSSSASKGVMLLVAALPELQLRRFDQQPLVVARSTRALALSSAIFARLCRQGYTTVRAAGPEATRLAMLAAAHARGKLSGCGLDLAVVPATEYVDVETLAASGGGSQYVDAKYSEASAAAAAESAEGQEWYGPGEELPKQFVQVTVLHMVRCVAGEPWTLLPWPVPAEQLPAAQHAQQQQQQHDQQLQQQQQQQVPKAVPQLQAAVQQQQQQLRVVPGVAVGAAAVVREQQQQQGSTDEQLQHVQLYGLLSGGLAAQRGSSNSSGSSYEHLSEETIPLAADSLQEAVQPASVAAAQRLQAAVRPNEAVGSEPAAAAAVALASTSQQGYVPPPLLLADTHLDTATAGAAAAASAAAVWRKAAPVVDPSAALLLAADGLLSPEQLQSLQEQQQQQQQQLEEDDKASHTAGVPSLSGSSSSSSNIVSRQPSGLLLQQKHSKKGSRQLVAAAQASSSTSTTPSCSSN
jgi:stage V sporulation protein SpoVS